MISKKYRIICILLFSLSFQKNLIAQEKAIRIMSEISFEVMDDALLQNEYEIDEINNTSYTRIETIGKDFFQNQTNSSSVENITVVNFRDSIFYYTVDKETHGKDTITILEGDAAHMKITQVFPDRVKNILNRKAHQVELLLTAENVLYNAWVDSELFHRYYQDYNVPLFEGILEFNYIHEGIQTNYRVIEIDEVDVIEDFYSYPENSSITSEKPFYQDNSEHSSEIEKYKISKDSLLLEIQNIEKQHQYTSISPFKNGIAKVETNYKSVYINTKGDMVFEELLEEFHPHQHSISLGQGFWSHTKIDSLTYYLTQTNNRFRILKENGKPTHSGDFEKIIRERNTNFFGVYEGGKKGLMNTKGNLIVPVQFEEVIPLTPRYFVIRKNKKFGIFDIEKQQPSIVLEYEDIDYCGGCDYINYVLLEKHGKWGILNLEGKELLPFKYDHKQGTQKSSGKWVKSLMRNGKSFLINLDSKNELDITDYENITPLSEMIIHWEKDKQFGLMNENGKQILQKTYDFVLDEIYPANPPYLKVYKNGNLRTVALIDTLGNSLLSIGEYETADLINNNFFLVGKKGKKGLLDANQNMVLPMDYEDIRLLVSEKDAKTQDQIDVFSFGEYQNEGIFFSPSKKVIAQQFKSVRRIFNRDSSQVYIEVELALENSSYKSKKGLYSILGEELISAEYDNLNFLTDGFFVISKDSKYGLVDVSSKKIIETPRYSSISKIDENLIQLKEKDHAKIFSTKTRKYLFPEHTYFAKTSEDSIWIIGKNEELQLYDFEKQRFISESFKNSSYLNDWNFKNNLLAVVKGSKTGVINIKGKTIIPFEYDNIEIFESGEMRLEKYRENDVIEYFYAKNNGQLIHKKPYFENRYSGMHEGSARMNSFFIISEVSENDETKYGLMHVSGKEIVKPVYSEIMSFNEDNGFATRIAFNGDYSTKSFHGIGILNKDGDEILPPILDRIRGEEYYWLPENFPVLSELNGYYFYIDENGEILPFISRKINEN